MQFFAQVHAEEIKSYKISVFDCHFDLEGRRCQRRLCVLKMIQKREWILHIEC